MTRRSVAYQEGFGCHYCGRHGPLTWDHIVPRSSGGRDRDWNIVPSCEPCNRAKAADMPTCRCPRCLWAVYRWEGGDCQLSAFSRRQRAARKRIREAEQERDRALAESLSPSIVPNWML